MGKVKPTTRKSRKWKKRETAEVPIEKTEVKRPMLRKIREEGYVTLTLQPGLNRVAIVQITLERKKKNNVTPKSICSIILKKL